MRGVQTWLNTGDLETVKLEIYNPPDRRTDFPAGTSILLMAGRVEPAVSGPTPNSSDTPSKRRALAPS